MNDKYKMFKNFMHNELGISREDIRQWVLEAIKEEVQAISRNMNLEQVMKEQSMIILRDHIYLVRAKIADKLADKLEINIKNEQNRN